eukprot:TRINITY_DN9438_c0_g1_i1.p1 TRINITY_DN9438_c0_g1~~TRINITY_DN9438_c0_g1_i1.p1  ORF type:complete len:327 (-),score=52.94 TRINITY_DN9438_c0_g1_i1:60-1040(-)
MQSLAEAGHYVVTFDLPGLGLSDKPTEPSYSWHYLADRIEDIVTALNLPPFHFVLHDISGPVGLEFAIKNPLQIRSLTFTNSFINVVDYKPCYPLSLFDTNQNEPSFTSKLLFDIFSSSNYLISQINHKFIWNKYVSNQMTYKDSLNYAFLLRFNAGKNSFIKIVNGFDNSESHNSFLKTGLGKLVGDYNVSVQTVYSVESNKQREYLEKSLVDVGSKVKGNHFVENAKYFLMVDQPDLFSGFVLKFVNSLPATPKPKREEYVPDPSSMGAAHSHGHSHGHGMEYGHDSHLFGGIEVQYAEDSHAGHSHGHGGHDHSHGHSHGHSH